MPFYHTLGVLPRKRHTAFRQADGKLYCEELVGSHGFQGPSSLLYHMRAPTRVLSTRRIEQLKWEVDEAGFLRPRHFRTGQLDGGGYSAVLDRIPLLFNAEVAISLARPSGCDEFFYRNGQGDELIFVSEGNGILESPMGELEYGPGDYVVIPRGIIHRHHLIGGRGCFLIIETASPVRTPARYRNDLGQLTENSPFCERDIRRPDNLLPYDDVHSSVMLVKRDNALVEVVLDHHPIDVVGWDGYYYPWALSIHDFEPRVGRVHLPSPFHQTFEGEGFGVCSFVPRPLEFDPEAVPAPYYHSNVMADEVIYHASDEFTSRRGIERGSLTLHPDGLVHGPHPGMVEESMGSLRTDEVAVKIETSRPLRVSRAVLEVEDARYWRSWSGEGPG